jgi:predicted transcriptional regulator
MYEQGCSIQDISEKVKAHPVSVGIKIRKMGLTRAKKISEYRTKLFGQDKKLIKMRNKGMSYKEIAKALGVSPNTVMNHFKKMEDMIAKVEIPKITEDYIREIMENSEFETHTTFNKCTVVSCRLPNGFVITESSACVNPEDYSVEIGEEICINKIADKIWELEAYRLQQWLWEESMIGSNSEDCPHGCDDCVNCTCDCEDECLNTDIDCDDCEDYDCPFNPNC